MCILPIKITNDKMPPATCSRDPHSRHLKFLREQKKCNISSRSLPLITLIPLHLKWVRSETTLNIYFLKIYGQQSAPAATPKTNRLI